MTKQDYERIAKVLKAASPPPITDDDRNSYNAGWKEGGNYYWRTVVDNLATSLAETNPLFDKQRFLAACGGHTEVVKPSGKVFKIQGYWVDDKSAIKDYLVSENDEIPDGYDDSQIFFYGLSESEIRQIIAKRESVHDFIITDYEVVS